MYCMYDAVFAIHTHTLIHTHTHTHTHIHTHTHTQHARACVHTHTQLVEDWNVNAPSFTFTKLDADNEEHHKLVNEYWSWQGDFDGRGPEPIDGKIFK